MKTSLPSCILDGLNFLIRTCEKDFGKAIFRASINKTIQLLNPTCKSKSLLYWAIISLLLFFISFTNTVNAEPFPSYTFWYGLNPPVELLSQFDNIIVEADHLSDQEIKALKQHGNKVLAYLSLGEWNPQRTTDQTVEPAWIMGSNQNWHSNIMDLTAEGWKQFVANRIEALKKRGFEGLFLDTLDSYMLLTNSALKKKKQQQGLVDIIAQIKEQQPDFLLVANRGFEIMDRIATYLDAVAAESMYQGWDNAKQQYVSVSENDRNWLRKTLNTIKSTYNLNVVILDYLPPAQRESARKTARKIEQDGFIPWVSNPSLDYMGIGLLEAIPRKVLLLYDSKIEDKNLINIKNHRFVAPLFEYLGYIPEYADIQQNLPKEILKGRYIGLVSWLLEQPKGNKFKLWLQEKIDETIPVALLGDLTFLKDQKLAELIGIRVVPELERSQLMISKKSDLIGYETKELNRTDYIIPLLSSRQHDNITHLRLKDKTGKEADLVVTGGWGGFAGNSALLDEDFNYLVSWIIDPIAFFKKAFQLPQIPVPDITTENGRRLFFIHVDGDGFMTKFETPGKGYAAQVLLENIFKIYPVPHTISIIEGEISSTGIYPEISSELEAIAQRIFALNHVEIASHSYSHPFKWEKITEEEKSGSYHLSIKDYTFNLQREIVGSVNYINTRLAPVGKKTSVFLWTGDCLPTPEAMALVARMGLLNMNGGDTKITKIESSLSNIRGMGLGFVNGEFQTYAPVANDNLFTNLWTGPFFGYHRVIETFKLTDVARRMKPINIYYHFYSGSKQASLNALKRVYDWAMQQETMPIYASDYIRKVLNYRKVGIAKRSDDSWRVTGLHDIKTLRLDRNSGWPQDVNAFNIVGWRNLHDGVYLHVGTGSVVEFTSGSQPNRSLRLRQSNGRIVKWHKNDKKNINFRIKGNVPVLMEVENAGENCTLLWKEGILSPKGGFNNTLTFAFSVKDTGDAQIKCYE
jgi:polysaccharide biosynthesis protein PelA